MSGGGGGVIIIRQVIIGLTDPIVSGSLPAAMKDAVAAVCVKEPGDMDEHDKILLSRAVDWALKNLK